MAFPRGWMPSEWLHYVFCGLLKHLLYDRHINRKILHNLSADERQKDYPKIQTCLNRLVLIVRDHMADNAADRLVKIHSGERPNQLHCCMDKPKLQCCQLQRHNPVHSLSHSVRLDRIHKPKISFNCKN